MTADLASLVRQLKDDGGMAWPDDDKCRCSTCKLKRQIDVELDRLAAEASPVLASKERRIELAEFLEARYFQEDPRFAEAARHLRGEVEHFAKAIDVPIADEIRPAVETPAHRMLAQLCATSASGVHVRKPDGACVHCGTQANELSEDLARAATLEHDGHGYTIWRIGGRRFVPLDEANEAVRLARESAEKTEAPRAPEVCGCPYGQCSCDDGSAENGM